MTARRAIAAAAAALAIAIAAAAIAASMLSAAPARRSPAARLSLAQLAGQRIVYAYGGLRPPQSLLGIVRRGEAAGVILFSANIGSPSELHGALAALARANASSPVHAPLLVMTDQEGGLVRRLPGAPALSERAIGAAADGASLAAQAGAGAGRNLRAAGVNVNLAPVLGVHRSPGDFLDRYQRSYGSDPAIVARLGAAFIRAQQRTGVAATAKHFPGLGAAGAAQDTDERPVTLEVPRAQLRAVDERPFRAAIAAGAKLVMTSWAVYPALDPSAPAGLSPKVVGGELRGRLHFRGVTITDALGAGALRRYGGYGARAVAAARAGEDLLLCAGTTPAAGSQARNGLVEALRHNRLSRAAAERAAARVIALRRHP